MILLMKKYVESWFRLISGDFHGLLQHIWKRSEQTIADIHSFLPVMGQILLVQYPRLYRFQIKLYIVQQRNLENQ